MGSDSSSRDFLTILQEKIKSSQEFKTMLGAQTHCAGTVRAIIELFKKAGRLHNEQHKAFDYNDFTKPTHDNFHEGFRQDKQNFKEEIAQKLFSTPAIATTAQDMLFRINICGGAHVFLVIKQYDGWIILQAWHKRFSMLQWLGHDTWKDKACHEEFLRYGKGQKVTRELLYNFIHDMLDIGDNKLERLRKSSVPVPLELEITMWTLQ